MSAVSSQSFCTAWWCGPPYTDTISGAGSFDGLYNAAYSVSPSRDRKLASSGGGRPSTFDSCSTAPSKTTLGGVSTFECVSTHRPSFDTTAS
jgi:hypothetical protein